MSRGADPQPVARALKLSRGRGLLLLPALLLAAVAGAFDVAIETKVTPEKATVGDRVKLTITFRAPPAVKFEHVLSGTSFADWDLAGIASRPGRDHGDGTADTVFEVTLVPWSATLTATPGLPFNAVQPPGRVQAVLVKPQPVRMESVLAQADDTGDLRPPKGVIGYRSWWPWIAAATAAAAAAAGWWLWRRRKRRAAAALAPPVPAIPPEITARRALAALAASSLIEEGNVKLYYSELSDIFRRYVEGRFAVSALDRTTTELLPELRRIDPLRPLFSEIRAFLYGCDLVKFAKYVPGEPEIGTDTGRVRDLVESTSPRAPEPGAAASAAPAEPPPAAPPKGRTG